MNNNQQSGEVNPASKPNCPLCLGINIKAIGNPQLSEKAKEYIKADYRVFKCELCKYYFVYPRISFTNEQWKEIYGKAYFAPMTKWWAEERSRNRKYRLNLIQHYHKGPIRKFLDVGCGEGYVLIDALKKNWDVYGLDISDYRVEKAKTDKIEFSECDLLNASYPDNFFDAVHLDSVLEHVIDPNQLLVEINRVTKVGGLAYFAVPNEDSLTNWGRKLFYILSGKSELSPAIKPFKSPFHVVGFTKKSLIDMLKHNDFQTLFIRNFGGTNEWRKHKLFSRSFILNFGLLPMHFAARMFKKSIYIEVVAQKQLS